MHRLVQATLLLLIIPCTAAGGEAALWLPQSLSDHILFQQKEPIVLWGKAVPKSRILAEIIDEASQNLVDSARSTVDPDGHWKISLKPRKASFKKYRIKITNNNETRLIHDVLVGELWLTGGQSNMDLPLRYIIADAK